MSAFKWQPSSMVMDKKAWAELNAGAPLSIVRANWDGFSGEVVAVVWDDDDDQERELTAMIAAAPEMLEIVRAVVRFGLGDATSRASMEEADGLERLAASVVAKIKEATA